MFSLAALLLRAQSCGGRGRFQKVVEHSRCNRRIEEPVERACSENLTQAADRRCTNRTLGRLKVRDLGRRRRWIRSATRDPLLQFELAALETKERFRLTLDDLQKVLRQSQRKRLVQSVSAKLPRGFVFIRICDPHEGREDL